jgi:predicted MFS family arabinose efflux permease
MAARVAAGVFGGVLSALSQTIVGDVIPLERRGRAMGFVMSSFSISTVAGVPLGLFLAAHFNWHMPFLAIAAGSALLIILAWQTLPPMRDHLKAARQLSPLANLIDTARNRDHQRTLLFTFLMMFVGFVVIPYITLYTTSNGGISLTVLPYIYLCGGIATMLTAGWIGRAADTRGKVPVFRALALLTIVPVLGLTISAPTGLYGIFVITTLFFVFMSGRMIPGMAIVTSACNPPQRGTFMALNSAAQSLGMSVATYLGGLIISRDAQGLVLNYWASGLVGVAATLLSYWLVTKLRLEWNSPKP